MNPKSIVKLKTSPFKIAKKNESQLVISDTNSDFYLYDLSAQASSFVNGPSKCPLTSLKVFGENLLFTNLKGDIYTTSLQDPSTPLLQLNCKVTRQPVCIRCHTEGFLLDSRF